MNAPAGSADSIGCLPPGEHLDTLWRHRLADHADALAFDGLGETLSRAGFEALVQAEVRHLQAEGIGGGDIVAWLGHNSPRQLAALLACERLGAVLMPLNWRLSRDELLQAMRHAGVAALHVMPDCEAMGQALRQATDAAGWVRGSAAAGDLLLVYTSGTTGHPKGARHGSAQMVANARAAVAVQGLGAPDRVLAVLPMFHVGGLCIQLLPALLCGATIRLHPRFDPSSWLQDVARWSPSTSLMVPATMRAVIEHPRWGDTALASLRFLNSGSSVVPLNLIEAFHRRGVPVAQVYGATETGPFSIASTPADALRHPHCTGHPAHGVAVRLVDEQGEGVMAGAVGEIWVKGANVMRGYHRMPTDPAFADGWFRSGDLARCDAEGRFEVVGRRKDMLISGGENIYPAEIENLVSALPEVAECAVVGLPDERWGEVPVLALVLREGTVLDAERLHSLLAARLARYKHPRQVVQVPALPKTALGKVQKGQLLLLLQSYASGSVDPRAC